MTTNPSDEPNVPGSDQPAPPPPPAYEAPATPPAGAVPPPPGAVPPPAYGSTPPPAYGTTPPPAYGSTPPPAYGATPPPGYGAAPQAPGYGAPMGAPMTDADQRLWATLAHIGGLILSFIAPLVIWLMYKDRGRFVEEQAKEALNFQITVVIASIALTVITVVTFGLGSILWVVMIAPLVFMIMAAVAANKGEAYRYPVNIRFIK
ncbi:DUF4870 domain-containing protein [Actinotalea subterranea]|uniref:DUF4870 domain-containing protein n=1 Tax=Actinotalea subterranea TaxID=2607497 RepID=UPI0011EC8E17|nr:DUF4870 domain-containing protein [Actinotalea subterranea]